MRPRKAKGGNNNQSTLNRYVKPYPTGTPPVFSYFDLQELQNDPTLNEMERAEFKKIYLIEKQRFEDFSRRDPELPCAKVARTGYLCSIYKQRRFKDHPRPYQSKVTKQILSDFYDGLKIAREKRTEQRQRISRKALLQYNYSSVFFRGELVWFIKYNTEDPEQYIMSSGEMPFPMMVSKDMLKYRYRVMNSKERETLAMETISRSCLYS